MKNFLFHRVSPERDALWDPMDVDLFDQTIRYIKKKFEVRLFEQVDFKTLGKKEKHTATIMFDDGYKDNIQYAAPILKKHNIKASFYLATACIDKNRPTWTYVLDYTTTHSKTRTLNLEFSFLPEKLKRLNLDSLEELRALKPFLKTLSYLDREQVLTEVKKQLYDVEVPQIMMNWQDVKQLADEGHYIGSHSVNHFMLGTLANENVVLQEMVVSKQRIYEKIGYNPISFSYPIGSFNKDTIRLCKQAGYQIGLATKQATFNPNVNSIYEVPRIELYNESWWKTKLRIMGVVENAKRLIQT